MKPVVILAALGVLAPISCLWAAQTKSTATAALTLTIHPPASMGVTPTPPLGTSETPGTVVTPGQEGFQFSSNTLEINVGAKSLLTAPKEILVPYGPWRWVVLRLTFTGMGYLLTEDATHWYLHLSPGTYGKGGPGPFIRLMTAPDPRTRIIKTRAGTFPIIAISGNAPFLTGYWYRSAMGGSNDLRLQGMYKTPLRFNKRLKLPSGAVDAAVSAVLQLSPES